MQTKHNISFAMARCLAYLQDNAPCGVHLWPLNVVGVSRSMGMRCVEKGYARISASPRGLMTTHISPAGIRALKEQRLKASMEKVSHAK